MLKNIFLLPRYISCFHPFLLPTFKYFLLFIYSIEKGKPLLTGFFCEHIIACLVQTKDVHVPNSLQPTVHNIPVSGVFFWTRYKTDHLFWTEMGENRENAEETENTGILRRQVDQWDMPPQYLEKGKEYHFFAA